MKQRKRLSKIPNVVRPYVKDLEASHQVKISCFFYFVEFFEILNLQLKSIQFYKTLYSCC
jgi:hypothetical protein